MCGRLSPMGRVSTRRFLFLMMPRRRDCAKSVIESRSDLNRMKSWTFALWSVAGLRIPLLARDRSAQGLTMENAAVRWSSVLVSVVPAWPMGTATNSTLPQYFLRVAMRGEYFSVFSSSLMSQPRSLQNPISMMMIVHYFLLKEVGSGEGVFGNPLAYTRSGVVPCPASNNIWVFACGRTQLGMPLGASVHSASPAVAEGPQ